MFEGVQPWTKMVAYFIEKNGIKLGNMKVEANWWNVINSDRDLVKNRTQLPLVVGFTLAHGHTRLVM